MTTISGDSRPQERAGDRFVDPRVASRESAWPTAGRWGLTESDHLVALASSGRSIRLFTAPGGLESFGRGQRPGDPPTSH